VFKSAFVINDSFTRFLVNSSQRPLVPLNVSPRITTLLSSSTDMGKSPIMKLSSSLRIPNTESRKRLLWKYGAMYGIAISPKCFLPYRSISLNSGTISYSSSDSLIFFFIFGFSPYYTAPSSKNLGAVVPVWVPT
jgi:hypothetical protein